MGFFNDINAGNGTRDAREAMYLSDHAFDIDTQEIEVNGYATRSKAIVRKDTGKPLGIVGKGYTPVGPAPIYALAQNLMDSVPEGRIVSTLNYSHGGAFGIAMNLGKREFLSGDVIDMNFLIMAAFDGSMGVLGRLITSRWFCTNQAASSTALFNLRHTRFVEERMEIAGQMLVHYNSELQKFSERMRSLVNYKMPERRAVDWFRNVLPAPKAESKRSETIIDNAVETYTQLLVAGMGADFPGVRGTAYGAWNAMTEYVNHHRSTRIREGRDPEEVKFNTVFSGSGDQLIQKGTDSLLQLTSTVPTAPVIVA